MIYICQMRRYSRQKDLAACLHSSILFTRQRRVMCSHLTEAPVWKRWAWRYVRLKLACQNLLLLELTRCACKVIPIKSSPQSTHSPRHQTQGCCSHQSESVPSWCWTRRRVCPAETAWQQSRGPVKTHTGQSVLLHKGKLVFTQLTLTTSSPSMIFSFSRFSFRSSGLVLHLRSPNRPTEGETHQ